jgi:surface protein
MKMMFYNAYTFDQDISSWNVASVTDHYYFSDGFCPLAPAHHPTWP